MLTIIISSKDDLRKRRFRTVLHPLQGRGDALWHKHSGIQLTQRSVIQPFQPMKGSPASYNQRASRRDTNRGATFRKGEYRRNGTEMHIPAEDNDRHPDEQRVIYSNMERLFRSSNSWSQIWWCYAECVRYKRFCFLRDFHDMRCKYDRVFSIIGHLLDSSPQEDDFIIRSRKHHLVQMFHYDCHNYSLHK